MKLSQRIRAAARAWVVGSVAVDPSDTYWGRDQTDYSPGEYGDYISTSNAVYTCCTLRADLLAQLGRPVLYRQASSGDRTEVTTGNLYALLQKVNPFWTYSRLARMTSYSLDLWGVCYWFVERGQSGRGTPREIWWVRPDRVKPIIDSVNYISGYLYEPVTGMQPRRYEPSEVIWMPNPNPVDEFAGLSPLAAARLSADTASAMMKSNRAMFANGMNLGGFIQPAEGGTFTLEQAEELERTISRRFQGVDKAHKWLVMRALFQMVPSGVTQKDAEYLGGLNWTLEDVARAYRIPLDLVGGQRTYQNVEGAMKAVWTHAVLPQASFIAEEITEKLLPMFGDADVAEFDTSDIAVLQEDRGEIVTQMQALNGMGVPLNVLLQEYQPNLLPRKGDGYAWGDVWWAPMSLVPVRDAEEETVEPPPPAGPPPPPEQAPPEEDEPPVEEEAARSAHRAIEYGSDAHVRIWKRFVRRTESYEGKVGAVVVDLLKRQRDSIVDKLKAGRGVRQDPVDVDGLWDRDYWERVFRTEMYAVIMYMVADIGNAALEDLGLSLAFDSSSNQAVDFLRNRAQRFAQQVNETTWERLKRSLIDGIRDGEGIPELADRVNTEMGDRIRSSRETIARTEVIGASNGGTLEAWRQSGVVRGKTWLAALDERTRDSHVRAHGQTVALNENFMLDAGSGPAPGQIGVAAEDINCRCTMTAVLDV